MQFFASFAPLRELSFRTDEKHVISTTQHEANAPLLLVDLSEGFGGVDVHILDLARGLHGRRPYGVATIENSPLHHKLRAAGLHVESVPYTKRDPRTLLALWRIIQHGGYRLVDAHNEQSWLWGLSAAQLAGVPGRLATVHLPWRVIPGGIKGKIQEGLLQICHRWGCRFATVSRSIATQLQAIGVPEDKITVIYNAVGTAPSPAADENATPVSVAALTGWPTESYIITIVGRLTRQKGHHFLLQALAQVRERYPQVRCLIVGDGKLRPTLEAQVDALNLREYVYFTGFREDVGQLLAGCDLFCLSSYAEGLPYAALEACQYRLPLLLSAVDGIQELFTHGETAYLTPVSDVSALAAGIAWYIEHPSEAAAMGTAAQDFVQRKLTPATMLAAKEALYDRLAGEDHVVPPPMEQTP